MTERSFDAAVIGGGPAGGLTAGIIARAGYNVAIIEEHATVGEPVQCAGLITPRCFDMADFARDTILSEFRGADIYSPAGMMLEIGKEKLQAVAVDRGAFDRRIVENAMDSGAVLISGQRVKGFERSHGHRIILGDRTIDAKLIIGADGARSLTRRAFGLEEPEHLLYGFSADIAGLELNPERVKVFFGRELAPNFFAWMIPIGEVTRVGLCMRGGSGTVHEHFKMLFTAGETAAILRGGKILRTYAGIIPIGVPGKTYAEGLMLVGDAACQVKATSGGGIYPGLVCAGHCARTAVEALEKGDVSPRALSRYQSAWMSDIGDELKKALMMHRVLASLDDSQLEEIFGMLKRKDIIETINESGDIDYPSRLGWMLLKKEPGFLKFAGKFIKFGLLNQ